MLRQAEQRLRADFDRWASNRGIIDRVVAAGGADELGRRQAVQLARRFVAEELFQRRE